MSVDGKTEEQDFADAFDEITDESATKVKNNDADESVMGINPDKPDTDPEVVHEEVVTEPEGEIAVDYRALYEKEQQKTSSWDGRIRAANVRAEEAEKALALLKEEAPKGKEAVVVPPDEGGNDGTLDDFFSEFPDLKTPLNTLIDSKVNARIATIEAALNEIKPTVSSLRKTVETDNNAKHFNSIAAAHPDYAEIRDSGKLKAWVDSQPSILRGALETVLTSGTAKDVIEMYDTYKKQINQPIKPNTGTRADPRLANSIAVEGSPGDIPTGTKPKAVTFDDAWDEANSS